MFAIIDTTTREVQSLLDERPKTDAYQPPLISVYITSAEAASLTLPSDEWVEDPQDPNLHNKVHTPGTIVPAATLQGAIDRQDQIKAQLQAILAFGQSINGKAFSALTTTEVKGLLQLMFAMNGMIDINGNVDLSDFTINSIIKSVM